MLYVGAFMGATALACYWMPLHEPGDFAMKRGRAIAFSLLALSPLFHALNCRSSTASILSLRPMLPAALLASIIASAAIHLVAVLVPSLRPVFQTFPMSTTEWLVLLGLSAAIIPAVEAMKLVQRMLASSPAVEALLGPVSKRS
jgi:P-type Ca2+ transporter type 2C